MKKLAIISGLLAALGAGSAFAAFNDYKNEGEVVTAQATIIANGKLQVWAKGNTDISTNAPQGTDFFYGYVINEGDNSADAGKWGIRVGHTASQGKTDPITATVTTCNKNAADVSSTTDCVTVKMYDDGSWIYKSDDSSTDWLTFVNNKVTLNKGDRTSNFKFQNTGDLKNVTPGDYPLTLVAMRYAP